MTSRRPYSVPDDDLSSIRVRRSGVREIGGVGSGVEGSGFDRIAVRLIRGERGRGVGRGVALFAVDGDAELLLLANRSTNRGVDDFRARRQGRSRNAVNGEGEVGGASRGWRSLSSVVPGRSVSSPAAVLFWIRLIRSGEGIIGWIRSGNGGVEVLAESSVVGILVEDVGHMSIRVQRPSGNGKALMMLLLLLLMVLMLLLELLLVDLRLVLGEERRMVNL